MIDHDYEQEVHYRPENYQEDNQQGLCKQSSE